MTPQEELKIIASRYRWAFKELVVDRKCVEANRLSTASVAFAYLKVRLGSGRAVLERAKGELRYCKQVVVLQGDKREQLHVLAKEYPWALSNVVEDEKLKEAKELFSSVNLMYEYLKGQYKTGHEVLETLRWVIRVCKGPGKALGL